MRAYPVEILEKDKEIEWSQIPELRRRELFDSITKENKIKHKNVCIKLKRFYMKKTLG